MEHSTDEVSEVCKSERIQKMHRRICQIKASEKTEVKYMDNWWIFNFNFWHGCITGRNKKTRTIFLLEKHNKNLIIR